jgi:sodium/proline symporter
MLSRLVDLLFHPLVAGICLAGILAGGLKVVVWKLLQGGLFDLYEIVPGFMVSILAILLVSRLTRGRQPQGAA